MGEILEDENIEETDDLNELIEAKSIITDDERIGPIQTSKNDMGASPQSQNGVQQGFKPAARMQPGFGISKTDVNPSGQVSGRPSTMYTSNINFSEFSQKKFLNKKKIGQ